MPTLHDKLKFATARLRAWPRVVVAYSGGVDSTLLAVLAARTLGPDHVLAVTADSASLSRADLREAVALAGQLGLQHRVIATQEVADPVYRANTPARCYVCKHTLFVELEQLARAEGYQALLYGAIGDDAAAERPGQRAAADCAVHAPLQEAGLLKAEVRELARQHGLSNWARPQNACLASRVPHGQAVDERKLQQIEAAEAWLRARGFAQVRVRHLGARARVEVDAPEIARLTAEPLTALVAQAFAQWGFREATVAAYVAGGADQAPATEAVLFKDLGGVAQLVRAGES